MSELEDVKRNIDGGRYPDRFARLQAEILRRRDLPDPVPEPPLSPSRHEQVGWRGALAAAAVLLVLGIGGLGLAFGPQLLTGLREVGHVHAGLSQAFPNERFNVAIRGLDEQEVREITVTLAAPLWTELDDVARQKRAVAIARVALGEHPDPNRVTSVEVVFQQHAELASVSVTRVLGSYQFSPTELVATSTAVD